MKNKTFLLIECIALFLGIPTLIFFGYLPSEKFWILLTITTYCVIMLMLDKNFYIKKLWNTDGFKGQIITIGKRLVPSTIILFLIIAYIEPEHLFILIKEDFNKLLLIIVLYPLFSVYPQELIYRGFFFHRYSPLFTKQRYLVHISALAFAFLHIIYHNYTAVFITYGAGYLFGKTYAESKSLLATSVEHALYGLVIFTLGYGQYFYDSFVTRL